MNNELLLLLKKHTDTLIKQTKSKPQESLEIKKNKQIENFSFSPPKNFSEEGKGFLAETSFETSNFVWNITDKNNSFSISTPGHWNSGVGKEVIIKLNKLL